MRTWASIVVLAAVALGGCGEEPSLSAGSAEELHAQVAAVREAAGEGDRDAALEALDGLAARVRELEDAGSIAASDATALRRGIGRARRRVREELAEPAATATPAPTATAAPTAEPAPEGGEPGTGNEEQKGKGETEGKGQEKDKGKKGKP
jgi:hypothetical protein